MTIISHLQPVLTDDVLTAIRGGWATGSGDVAWDAQRGMWLFSTDWPADYRAMLMAANSLDYQHVLAEGRVINEIRLQPETHYRAEFTTLVGDGWVDPPPDLDVVIVQRQSVPFNDNWRSPVWHLTIDEGHWLSGVRWDGRETEPDSGNTFSGGTTEVLGDVIRGVVERWRVDWSECWHDAGWVEIRRNGILVWRYQGPNGCRVQKWSDLSLGLYPWAWRDPVKYTPSTHRRELWIGDWRVYRVDADDGTERARRLLATLADEAHVAGMDARAIAAIAQEAYAAIEEAQSG